MPPILTPCWSGIRSITQCLEWGSNSEEFAAAKSIALDTVYSAILGIIAVNGVPEAVVAVVIGGAVSLALLRIVPQTERMG